MLTLVVKVIQFKHLPQPQDNRLNLNENNVCLNYKKVKLKNPHLVIALAVKGIPSLFGLPGL